MAVVQMVTRKHRSAPPRAFRQENQRLRSGRAAKAPDQWAQKTRPDLPGLGRRTKKKRAEARFSLLHQALPGQRRGRQVSFSRGRSSQRHRAGRKMIAATIFTTNMKVSMMPMSAWNFRSEKIHIATPTARVSAV